MVWIIAKILKCLSTSILYFLLTNIEKYYHLWLFLVAGNLGTPEINLCKSFFRSKIQW